MKQSILILFWGCTFFASCISINSQQKCLRTEIKKIIQEPEYILIRAAAKDTLKSWSNKNVIYWGNLKRHSWEIDSAIYFNKDKTKALILILDIDSDLSNQLDYVKLLVAEKRLGVWHFDPNIRANIISDRTANESGLKMRPHTFEELSVISRRMVIKGGYYKWGTCNINYDYVDNWFKVNSF